LAGVPSARHSLPRRGRLEGLPARNPWAHSFRQWSSARSQGGPWAGLNTAHPHSSVGYR